MDEAEKILRMSQEEIDDYFREQRLYGSEFLKRRHDAELAETNRQLRTERMQENYREVFDTKTREEALQFFKQNFRCTQEDIDTVNAIYDEIEGQQAFDDAVLKGLRSVWGDEGSSAS